MDHYTSALAALSDKKRKRIEASIKEEIESQREKAEAFGQPYTKENEKEDERRLADMALANELTKGLSESVDDDKPLKPAQRKHTKPDGPAPVLVIMQRYGIDISGVQENGKWKNKLTCRCGANSLSVVAQANGTGGWKCHDCGWQPKKGQIVSHKKAQSQQETGKVKQNPALGLESALLPVIAVSPKLVTLTDSADKALLLSQLLYYAKKYKWGWFFKTDAHLMRDTRLSPWKVKQFTKWLVEQPWIEIKREGHGRRKHYRIRPRMLKRIIQSLDSDSES